MIFKYLVYLFFLQNCLAIKLIGVNLKSGALHVGRTTELTCDYLKWKQEQLYSVTWSIKYPGVKTNFFEYQADGSKSTPSSTFVQVDEGSSEEQRVNIRILDAQEEEVSICCEVKVLRDSGYGSMKPLRKEKCTDIKVLAGGDQLKVDIWSSHNKAEVGDTMDLVCKAKETPDPEPEYAIRVNGEEIIGVKRNNRLEARVSVNEDHFNPTRRSIGYRPQGSFISNAILVECLGKFGQHIAANSSMTITRGSKQSTNMPLQAGRGEVQRNSRTFFNDPVQHRDHKKGIPCHSYVIVESSFNQGSVIRGQISGEVLEDITSPTKTADDRLETSEDVVAILNILGYHGYQVVGVGNSMDNRMVWTLERKYFEFHQDEL
eukprot:TRINITY_DN6253_c0_g1_i1.p1 TRINITY_DN6253_c0_g1~~TRINITY_DN6253_c0_g1_i1.p1  ORF type:complete len:375 (+),score=59.41 TRINITY_DN6253_c0_g1_i1:222-1346(+)